MRPLYDKFKRHMAKILANRPFGSAQKHQKRAGRNETCQSAEAERTAEVPTRDGQHPPGSGTCAGPRGRNLDRGHGGAIQRSRAVSVARANAGAGYRDGIHTASRSAAYSVRSATVARPLTDRPPHSSTGRVAQLASSTAYGRSQSLTHAVRAR